MTIPPQDDMDEPEEEAEIAPEESSTPSPPSSSVSPNHSVDPSPLFQSYELEQYSDTAACSSTAETTDTMSLQSTHSSLPTLQTVQEITSQPIAQHKWKFIGKLEQIQCDVKGGKYEHTLHGITLYIPPGAVNEGTTFTITVGAATVGPFKYPENTIPVSPILWVQVNFSNSQAVLKKEIEIKIHHAVTGNDGIKHLRFLCCSKLSGTVAFERAHKKSIITPNEGVLHTKLSKNSYCFCISSKICQESIANTEYCMVKVRPAKLNPSNTWKMHFFVTYALPACIAVSIHLTGCIHMCIYSHPCVDG